MAISRGLRTLPAGGALAAAVAAALGAAPEWGGAGGRAVVVDASPSAQPPADPPSGAASAAAGRLPAALASAAAGGARRILLFTDGLFGPVRAPGVPVDVSLLPRRDDVGVLDVRGPGRVAPGEDFQLRVEVGRTEGPAAAPAAVDVAVERDGARVGPVRRLVLARGERRAVALLDRVEREGVVRYRVSVSGATGPRGNDVAEATVRVGDRPIAVAVGADLPPGFSGGRTTAAALSQSLREAPPDAILLAGGPLPEDAQGAVAGAVRAGAGLLVLGGAGYAGRPLESVLPLTDRPPSGRAVCLALDFSGSMEPRKRALVDAVARLRGLLAPRDLLGFCAFRDGVIAEAALRPAEEVAWDLAALRAHGNTLLAPALERAARLLEPAGAAERRLFVVSDGEWKDAGSPDLVEALRGLRASGAHVAAVFVGERVPEAAAALFPDHVRAEYGIEAALARAEEDAPGRTVDRVSARAAAPPEWLEPALPPDGVYMRVLRLYPRGAGESVALRGEEAPVVASLEPGGRVVMVAAPLADNPAVDAAALLRAVARPGGRARLRARREGASVVLEASGGGPHELRVAGRAVRARPSGPDRWTARVANESSFAASWGDAMVRIPARGADELSGLSSDAGSAAALARASGGRFSGIGEPPPADPGGGGRRVPAAPYLLAAALVVAGATARRAS